MDLKIVELVPAVCFLGIPIAYTFTFEFEQNGEKIQKTIKKYSIFDKNLIYKGWFIDNKKKNCIYVYGEASMGFLDFCVFGLGGLLLIILPIASYLGLSIESLILVFLGIIAMMIIISLTSNTRRKRNRRKGGKEI